jgi:hypothetical protein
VLEAAAWLAPQLPHDADFVWVDGELHNSQPGSRAVLELYVARCRTAGMPVPGNVTKITEPASSSSESAKGS